MAARHLLLALTLTVLAAFGGFGAYLASEAPSARPESSADAQTSPAPGVGDSSGAARESGPPAPVAEAGRAHHFDLELIADGFNRPTYVGSAPGDRDGIWVLEQPGRVIRLQAGEKTTLLDISRRIRTGTEQGLLGIAFHPDFASNRRLYLHWSDRAGDTRVAEFRAGGDHVVDPRPRRHLLHQEQPEENHNGGELAFGPDGRLHLALGDGGGAFDPRQTAQDRDSLLGKIVATDIDGEPRWEPVVTGLRNPWRFSFDFALGEIWIADVGQDHYEEINRVALEPDEPPKNAGWSRYEGTRRLGATRALDDRGELVWPVAGYTHDHGCSVTGGEIYGGQAMPAMARRYIYGDFCSGVLWTVAVRPGERASDLRREQARLAQLTDVGSDGSGELLFATGAGELYRAVPASSDGE